MQGDQHHFPQNPVLPPLAPPLADQKDVPFSSFFDQTGFPPDLNHPMPFQGVEFQPSDVCPRNFIIFDHTDNRSQIMFHPAIGSKFRFPSLNISAARKNSNGEKENSCSMKEDLDDIDALLSLEMDEDEESEEEEEMSTARTNGSCGSDSSDSCSNYGSKFRKIKHPSASQQSSGSSRSSERKKHRKMKKMVKALKGIVPGANGMNTVDVLEEAVRYLKSLKVQAQKLGVEKI